MLDFAKLIAVSGDDASERYSFVGISGNQLRLPKGCASLAMLINETSDAELKFVTARSIFVTLFSVLQIYRQTKAKPLTTDRDSAQEGDAGGRELLGRNGEEDVFYYRHLSFLDGILDSFDERGILSLVQRQARQPVFAHQRIDRNLERATYQDDTAIIDDASIPRSQAMVDPVEIVQLYCYVIGETKELLGQRDSLAADIRVLGDQFAEHHLAAGDGLFEPKSWNYVRSMLLERLEVIDQNTAFKDDDYHILYDALFAFLDGQSDRASDGPIWGISTFAPVWEDVCRYHLLTSRKDEVVACDTSSLVDLSDLPTGLAYTQISEFSDGGTARLHMIGELQNVFLVNGAKIYPDCVVRPAGLDGCRQAVYARFGRGDLGDTFNLVEPLIDIHYNDVWKDIRSQSGPTQREAAPKFLALLNDRPPGALTAFMLGRAVAGAYEVDLRDSRANIFNRIISTGLCGSVHPDFLLGVIWETYFDKSDSLRDRAALARRKSLGGYVVAMAFLASPMGTSAAFQEVGLVATNLEAASAEELAGAFRPCTVIDFKYFDISYFGGNNKELRERSMRKQFVYEYLLHQSSICQHGVVSEFWIPTWSADERVEASRSHSKFMGDSIPICHINLRKLIETYCSRRA